MIVAPSSCLSYFGFWFWAVSHQGIISYNFNELITRSNKHFHLCSGGYKTRPYMTDYEWDQFRAPTNIFEFIAGALVSRGNHDLFDLRIAGRLGRRRRRRQK